MKKNVGLIGAFIIAVGCFLPAVHLPIVGGVSLLGNGTGDGILILILAAVSAILVSLRRPIFSLIPVVLSGALTVVKFLQISERLTEIHNSASQIGIFGEALSRNVQLGVAWLVLVVGLILSVAAPFLSEKKTATQNA